MARKGRTRAAAVALVLVLGTFVPRPTLAATIVPVSGGAGALTLAQAIVADPTTLVSASFSAHPAPATELADGTLATATAIGATTITINVTSECAFAVTGGLNEDLILGFESLTVTAAGAVSAGQQTLQVTATLQVHTTGEFAEQTVADCSPSLPNGTSNALSFFPTAGSTFAILTSGDVLLADDANTAVDSGFDLQGPNVRGDTDLT